MNRQLTGLCNDYYVVLATAFVHAPQARTLDTLRVEVALGDKLTAISRIATATPGAREWNGEDTTLVLSQQEIELLRERITQVAWHPQAAARVVHTYDWLGTGTDVTRP